MSKFLFLIFTLVGSWAMATVSKPVPTSEFDLNLYLPGLQFRFEDGSDQSRSLKNGYGLNLGLEIYKKYLLGFEYNILNEKNGNASLSIAREFTELNVMAGFLIYKFDLAPESTLQFFGQAFLGQNKNILKTELLGSTTIDESAPEMTYGLGALARFQIKMFMLECGTRMSTSKSYEPTSVSVTDLRVGFQINL